MDFGEQGILQRREAGAGNDQSAGTGAHCDGHSDRPDDEPSGEDERERKQAPMRLTLRLR